MKQGFMFLQEVYGVMVNVHFSIYGVFYPNAQSYQQMTLQQTYKNHELEKKRAYGERIREVEEVASHHWCYHQLVVWQGR
jgi:hypothetical protein